MSCNGCRVLRKGCDEDCTLRPCLVWITSPESQANATLFLAKFYGRAGLLNLINAGPHHLRPDIFRSLLHEACGRVINPTYGSLGLIWSGNWEQCQAAVESVLQGSTIMRLNTNNNNHDYVASQNSVMPLEGCDIRHLSKDPRDEDHREKMRKRFKRPRGGSSSTCGGGETDANRAHSHDSLSAETVEASLLDQVDQKKSDCDPNGALISWNSSSHFCNWSGVSCGKHHRRVTVIQIESGGLQGSLSPHVGNLSFLRVLSLSNNSFHGTIPHELGQLSRLRILYLYENKFSGVIPTNLSRCFNLEALSLGGNKLVGIISMEISFLSNLILLSVNDNNLTGGISPFLGNLTSLEVFSIPGNPLGGSIPDTLSCLKSLSLFYASECNLHGTIPRSIYNLSLLTRISLSVNRLTGNLPLKIGSMLPNLQGIQLRDNQFSGLLPPSMSNCSKLEYLETSYNNFSGKLTIDFANLKDISYISLQNNNFNGGGDPNEMKIIDSLGNCSKLEELALGSCNFQGVVPASIGNLSNQLSRLSLERNQLYGSLPSSIGNLVGLTALGLSTNRFTGKIPSTIGMLRKLQGAYLDENQFTGPIPSAIGNLSILNLIYLSSNILEGDIPPTIGNCYQLQGLALQNNKLNGKIPKQLFQLTSLFFLYLSYNNLSGSLPTEVQNLKSLNDLIISYNHISGSIPSSLGGCTSLSYLYINDNFFEGIVPPSLSSIKGVERIDLSHNILSGQIPQFLERFSLEYLNLSFNNFEGEVPVKGVFANASAFSIWGNNRLCGGLVELRLPKCKMAKKHHKRFPLFIILILVSCTLFSILFFVGAWFKKKNNDEPSQSSTNERFLKVSYNQLLKATDGFAEANLIGQGSSSSVYKGTLDYDDTLVAVNVLNLQIRGAHKRFIAECETWRSIRHRNLLKIITSCSSVDFKGNDFKALVYEFMPNGSLHDWLHSNANISKLDLFQRINILIDVASALDYLHNQCLPTVVHGDIKPNNILLDNDMMAHVGDFGLAKLFGTNSNQSSSTGVKGTIGYAPPEYGLGSKMTSSGDVYSFGILLLEVMTRKKPIDDIFNEDLSLHKFAHVALLDQVMEVIDGDIVSMQSTEANAPKLEECLASTIKIGVSCSVDSPLQRMNVNNVVHELLHVRHSLQNLEV
uniref:putative receptor-like protein kinase At3g47110 n=1 Tax=Erigeron canadensis TaxID=72917 RepID=UPI001CB9018F|nr:putative receptor-like protein kinase At3g47110 [Erigeron canadensis]